MPALKLKDKDGNWTPLPTIKGADGKSAYQQAVEAGYNGTEAAFYAALVSLKDGPFLPTKGGTMTGELDMGGMSIELGSYSSDTHSLLYYDETRGALHLTDGFAMLEMVSGSIILGNMQNGNANVEVMGVAAPTSDTDAANKGYVDSKAIQYGTCTTAAATAAKVVTLSGFTLATGSVICVKFTYANTNTAATLNVNSTGAKSIRCNNAAVKSNMILAGMYALFQYDGTYWQLLNPAPTSEALLFTNKTIATTAWVSNSTYSAQGYAYRASVACAGVTTSHRPDVAFSAADAVSGNFAPVTDSYAGGVYIYCKTKPTATVTIPSIVCVKGA